MYETGFEGVFTYPDEFTQPNSVEIVMAHSCSDNWEPTVLPTGVR